MLVNGPPPVNPSQRVDDAGLALRLNQRITAEVLMVAGERVTLSVQGVRIVARLTTPDQAAQLTDRRTAQFIVREMNGQTINLQLAPTGQAQTPAAGPAPVDLAAALVRAAGLPSDAAHVMIARALLEAGLPVNAQLLEELRAALQRTALSRQDPAQTDESLDPDAWSEADARLAVSLRAAGQPVTPAAMDLSGLGLVPLGDALARLRAALLAARVRLSGPANAQAEAALTWLDSLTVNWGDQAGATEASLRSALTGLGHSTEAYLKEMLYALDRTGGNLPAGDPRLALLRLRQMLTSPAQRGLADEIDRFLDQLRARQYASSDPLLDPPGGLSRQRWLSLDLPLESRPAQSVGAFAPFISAPALPQAHETGAARLKIALRPDEEGAGIDPANTRLVLDVDLGGDERVQVDLSIVENHIGAWVSASNEPLRRGAQEGLPELKAALEKLGYALQKAQVGFLDTSIFDEGPGNEPDGPQITATGQSASATADLTMSGGEATPAGAAPADLTPRELAYRDSAPGEQPARPPGPRLRVEA
jgi:hypothetical protein